MAWVAVASTAVGAGLQAYNQHNQPSGPGAPTALPGPTSPGSFTNNQTTWTRDPVTGQIVQQNLGFDPSGMGANLDAESMWNQFMGRDNSSQGSDLEWQIKKLQQDYDRMAGSGQAQGSSGQIPAEFQELQKYIDPSTGKLVDIAAIQQGQSNPAVKALYDVFIQQTGGNYGRGGWRQWSADALKNIQPKYEAFVKTQGVQSGNAATNQKALDDLKNQIEYLTQQKARITAPGSQVQNPLQRFLTDTGPKWQGGDNTNPYTDEWGNVTDAKIAGINDDPMGDMARFGLGGEGSYSGKMEAELNGLGPGETMGYSSLAGARLDPAAAARLREVQDFQIGHEYNAKAIGRDALAARRGMLNSSVSDMQRADDQEGMIMAQMQAGLNAANMGNDITAKNFSMESEANRQNNQFGQNATQANNANELNRRQMRLSGFSNLNNIGNQNYQNFLQGKNQSFQQALASLGAANAMRTEDRGRDVQDYQFGRDENNTGYGRASDMWNRLSAARQQATGNNQAQQGLNTGAAGQAAQINMQNADWGNQSNVANAQMQNSFNTNQANQRAAQANASQNMWANLAGVGLNSYFRQPTGSGSSPNSMGGSGALNDMRNQMGGDSYTPYPTQPIPDIYGYARAAGS